MANEFDDAAVVSEKPSGGTAAEVSRYQINREGNDVKLIVSGQFPDSGYTLAVFRGGSRGKPVYELLQRKKDGPALDVKTPFTFRTTVRSAHGVAAYVDSRGSIEIAGLREIPSAQK
jgi:hypothetical protein